ncbi:hypothetical protein ABZM74_000625 [Weissella confusa]|uniref:hypothetical protein n=1 Tax=Weissella confusa TaxID=1583 RepID=UPI00358F2AF6
MKATPLFKIRRTKFLFKTSLFFALYGTIQLLLFKYLSLEKMNLDLVSKSLQMDTWKIRWVLIIFIISLMFFTNSLTIETSNPTTSYYTLLVTVLEDEGKHRKANLLRIVLSCADWIRAVISTLFKGAPLLLFYFSNIIIEHLANPEQHSGFFDFNTAVMLFGMVLSIIVYTLLTLTFFNLSTFIKEVLLNTDESSPSYIIMNNLKEFLLPIIAILISILALLLK